jgi:hypothetical protein
MAWVNQYSFLLVSALLVAVLAVALFRDGVRQNDLVALGSLILGLAFAYALFRPLSSPGSDTRDVLDTIGGGSLVLLELQSPY